MALAMVRPFRHPKTGVYWLRKVVPGEVRDAVGKRELKVTLGTKDVREAKAGPIVERSEAIIAAARTGGVILTQRASTPCAVNTTESRPRHGAMIRPRSVTSTSTSDCMAIRSRTAKAALAGRPTAALISGNRTSLCCAHVLRACEPRPYTGRNEFALLTLPT
jgi:hypothetical protein